MLRSLTIFALLTATSISAQTPSRISDTITPDSCRFTFEDDPIPNCLVTIGSHTYIAAPYRSRLDFNKNVTPPMAAHYGLAWVIGGNRFMYVDHSGLVRISDAVEFDNGPSDFHYGLVPVHANGKYNYANPSGTLLFTQGFDWSSPFGAGRAYGCVGCRKICRYPPSEWGECEDIDISWVGGQWFRLTPDGRALELAQQRLYKWMLDPGEQANPTFHR